MSEKSYPSDDNSIPAEDSDSRPLMINIKEMSLKNNRTNSVLWSGRRLQLNSLCVPAHSETGNVRYSTCDQFLCVTQGCGLAITGKDISCMNYHCQLQENSSIFIPCETWLNLINTGEIPLKFYVVQSLSH